MTQKQTTVGDKIKEDINLVNYFAGASSTSGELLKGKVVIFGIPGAFTSTCTARHVPSFVDEYDKFVAAGYRVVCLAWNDGAVMEAYAKLYKENTVTFVGDGSGELVKSMGLVLDCSAYGMGLRCKRFAMIVQDFEVKWMEVDQSGCQLSAAGNVLEGLAKL